jgi:AcrR family transcriptional regulator
VPRTRSDVDRDEKVDEIVDAARRRLVEGGYAALSVSDVARELGLAQSAIYWYFPTKDHLFVAAVERILHDILARKPRKGTCVDQVIWFAERLGDFKDLRIAMRERGRSSEVVGAFEADVIALLRVMLANALSTAVDADQLDDTTDAVMALCEGVLLRDIGKAKRARLIRFGFDRLVTQR